MAKRRLRKVAKDIKKQPKLKKKIAEFLANNYNLTMSEARQMLLKGHRGYLSMHEKELSDLFDAKYDELLSDIESKNEEIKEYEHDAWYVKIIRTDIDNISKIKQEAEEIYDAIFEGIYLT